MAAPTRSRRPCRAGGYDAVVVGAGHNGARRRGLSRPGRPADRSSSSGASGVGGAADTAELAPASACRRSPTRSAGCGRRSCAISTSGATGCRSSRPMSGSFAPGARRPGDHALGRPGADGRRARGRSTADADAYAGFDRQVRSLGRFLDELGASTPPDIQSPGLATRWPGCGSGAVPRPRRARRPDGPARPADGRRRLRRPRRSRPTRSGRRSPGAASATRRSGRGRRDRRRSCSTTRPATTVAPPARRSSRAAGRAPCRRRSRRPLGPPAPRSARGAEVAAITSRDGRATGVVLASGEEIEAPVVVAGSTRSGRCRPLDPVALGPVAPLAGRQHPDAGRRGQGQPRPCAACRGSRPPAATTPSAAPRADRRRARHRRASSGRSTPRSTAGWSDARSSRRRSRRSPTRRSSRARRPGTHVMSVIAQYAPYALARRARGTTRPRRARRRGRRGPRVASRPGSAAGHAPARC